MDNINSLLSEKSVQVSHLLRRYRVFGDPTLETINRAHQQHGAPFMTKLLAIVTPESNFSNLGDILNPGSFIDTAFKAQQAQQAQQTPKTTGKFWNFWDKLLNNVNRTGQTIGQFKTDANGQPIPGTSQPAATVNPKTIYIIAAVIIVVIVAILLIKRKA